jgi:hypothetical protein
LVSEKGPDDSSSLEVPIADVSVYNEIGEQIVQETIAPTHHSTQTGLFAGITPTDEHGNPLPLDITPTTQESQEDLGDITFPNVAAALASKDIRWENDPMEGVVFFEISTNNKLENLKGIAPVDLATQMGLKWETPKASD